MDCVESWGPSLYVSYVNFPLKRINQIINIAVDGPVCVSGADLCRPILLGALHDASMHGRRPPAPTDRLQPWAARRKCVNMSICEKSRPIPKCAGPACMHARLLLLHVGRVNQPAARHADPTPAGDGTVDHQR